MNACFLSGYVYGHQEKPWYLNILYVKASYTVKKLYAENLSIIGDGANQVLNILKGSILWSGLLPIPLKHKYTL